MKNKETIEWENLKTLTFKETIENYLNQNPSMIEDLKNAAGMIEKKSKILASALRKYAKELAPYSPFDYPAEMGFKSPFNKE